MTVAATSALSAAALAVAVDLGHGDGEFSGRGGTGDLAWRCWMRRIWKPFRCIESGGGSCSGFGGGRPDEWNSKAATLLEHLHIDIDMNDVYINLEFSFTSCFTMFNFNHIATTLPYLISILRQLAGGRRHSVPMVNSHGGAG